MLPLVSIIIPTYEQDCIVLDAVQSALAQNYPNLEIIVCDDASPTCSYTRVKSIKDQRLRFVRNGRNLGRVGNYRHALRDLARGQWVVCLDGDDYFIDSSFVAAAMERVAESADINIVTARCITKSSESESLSASPGDLLISGSELVKRLPRQEYLFMHLATLYRRDIAIELDFYRSNSISSDWESLYRLALRGEVAFMDRCVGVWRVHDSNATKSSGWRIWAENLEIWPAIFQEAVAFGLDQADADNACRKCLVRFGAMHLPSVMRSRANSDVLRYLMRIWELDRRAMIAVLASHGALARLIAGLLGYYRSKQW